MATERGVELFALTDHDTFAGCEDARATLPAYVTFIPALEMSCKYAGKTVHLLTYGPRDRAGTRAICVRLDEVLLRRRERLHAIVARFAELGIELDADEILAGAHGTPGRPHVAAALVRKRVCSSVREAFDRFLHDGGPADVAIDRVSLDEGIELAVGAGARCSIAHPHTLKSPALVAEILKTFAPRGLGGLEAHYGTYAAHDRDAWTRMAQSHGVVTTGGSDYHGTANPSVRAPVIEVSAKLGAAIREWLAPEEIPVDVLAS